MNSRRQDSWTSIKKWFCYGCHRVALVVHMAQKSVPDSAGEWPTFLPPPLESCSGTANVDGPNSESFSMWWNHHKIKWQQLEAVMYLRDIQNIARTMAIFWALLRFVVVRCHSMVPPHSTRLLHWLREANLGTMGNETYELPNDITITKRSQSKPH